MLITIPGPFLVVNVESHLFVLVHLGDPLCSFLDDVYYFIFGAKKIAVLAFGDQLAKTLDEGEVEALSFVVMWSGEELNYESNDEVRWWGLKTSCQSNFCYRLHSLGLSRYCSL